MPDIQDIWHDFMKNFEFRCTKKCPGKEFILEFTYEFIENHECIFEFMKKTFDFGCTKKWSKNSLTLLLYMNSYLNSYSHM